MKRRGMLCRIFSSAPSGALHKSRLTQKKAASEMKSSHGVFLRSLTRTVIALRRSNCLSSSTTPRPRRLELRNDRTRRGCQYLLRIRIICSLAKGLPPSPADALGLQAGRFGDTVWLRRSGVICHLTNDALTYFSAMIANSTIVMIAPFFRLATTRIIRV